MIATPTIPAAASRLSAVLLGTLAGLPVPLKGGRASYAVLITAGSDLLLFDTGRGATTNFGRAGYSTLDLRRVFFTHLHSDHVIDYPDVVLSPWASGRAGAVYVYGPEGSGDMTRRLFGPDGAFSLDIRARIEASRACRTGVGLVWPEVHVTELFDPGEVCGTARWRVSCTFVRHHARYFSAMAYRVDMDGHSIVVGGDSTPDEAMVELARGADVLIHEGSYLKEGLLAAGMEDAHCSAEDAADIARRAGVGHLVITHITRRTTPEKLARAESVIRAIYPGQVSMAHDFMTITL
jgi:ribonuclease Z